MAGLKVIKEDNVLTIERVIDAPKDKVWEAWTTPETFEKWWGPSGWETTVKHFDFTPGGYVLYGMKCVDEAQTEWFGKTSWSKAEIKTVQKRKGFSYTDYFCDEEGNITEGMPVTNVELSFKEANGKTKMTDVSTFESEATLERVLDMGMEKGVRQTWERLAKLLQETA